MEILPIEIRQHIVTIPWIKHLNLYVCKEWYRFVYDNLPDVNLEQYIRARDYFSIMYINLNFQYKLREIDNIKIALEVNDIQTLKLIIDNFQTLYQYNMEFFWENDRKKIIILSRGIINNHLAFKYLRQTDLMKYCDFDSIYKMNDFVIINKLICHDEDCHYFSKYETSIISNLAASYTKFCVQYKNKFSFGQHFGKNAKNKIKFKNDVYEKAYFECIRHGFLNIINLTGILRKLYRSEVYNRIHFSLALSGTCKIKYFDDYLDLDLKFTELVVESMNLQDRHTIILEYLNK